MKLDGAWMTKEMGETHQIDNSPGASHGSSAVNIVISDKYSRWIIAAIVALIITLFMTNRTSVGAELKANQAVKASEDLQTEFRVTQLYLQAAKATCQQSGINLPPIPASMK